MPSKDEIAELKDRLDCVKKRTNRPDGASVINAAMNPDPSALAVKLTVKGSNELLQDIRKK